MAKTLDLNHGPWNEVFSGDWQGHEVNFYQNPDKWTMLMIVDKDQEQIKGILISMSKYFTFKGSPESFTSAIGGNTLVFEKNTPTFKANYMVLSSKARYAKPNQDSIHEMIEENFAELREKSEQAIESSTAYQVELTELKNSPKEVQDKLLITPAILKGVMTTEAMAGTTTAPLQTTNDSLALIGTTKAGEPSEAIIQSFLTTIIYGKPKEIKTATHVALESCILSNVMVIMYDEENYFERIKTPNQNFDKEHYPTLQPIGMPVKTIEPQKLGINLELLDGEMFKELFQVNEKSESGQRALDHITYHYSQETKSLEELAALVAQEPDAKKLFDARRAVRFLELQNQLYPDYFQKGTDISLIISAYMKSIAQVIRMPIGKVTVPMKKAILLTISKALNKYYKEHSPSTALKAIHMLPDANSILPADDTTKLGAALLEEYKQAQQIGIGYLLGLGLDKTINQEITNNETIRIEFVTEQEVAIKTKDGKPYRSVLRPPLSAY